MTSSGKLTAVTADPQDVENRQNEQETGELRTSR
jgi:hypothetical protein